MNDIKKNESKIPDRYVNNINDIVIKSNPSRERHSFGFTDFRGIYKEPENYNIKSFPSWASFNWKRFWGNFSAMKGRIKDE